MRLDKFICKSTDLAKVDAIQCINDGAVSLNDAVARNESTQVHENNTVLLNGVRLKARDFRYMLMHKPAGTVCSNIDEVYPSLLNYIKVDKVSELHIAGRLDVDTTGLVLVTDDGRWTFEVTVPAKKCPKVYRVGLSTELTDEMAVDVMSCFVTGVKLQGEQVLTRPAALQVISPKEVLLTITEGKFHQVKRMFAAVGNRVVSLHRQQIGDVCLDVEVGQWRYLTLNEVKSFTR